MLHFKEGLGWKACYDDEKNLYTAKTSWRGDFHLYEINAEIYNQLDEPDVDVWKLIQSGRQMNGSLPFSTSFWTLILCLAPIQRHPQSM